MTAISYQGYQQELSDLRLSFSRAGAITGIVLVLLGVGLDYGLYPQHQVLFGAVRGVVSLLILLIMFCMPTRWGKPHVPALTLLWLSLPQIMIAWMIWYTDGAESLYYAGLNLAIFAVGIVMPVGFIQTVAFGAFTYVIWIIACVMHAGGIHSIDTFIVYALLLFFSVISSSVFTYFNELGRFQLFRLKEEVAQKNQQLALTNQNLTEIKGQLLQQEKMAAIGTLSAGLLHEINNPVNFCLMAISVAQEDPTAKDSPMLLECLADAKEGMQRVQHIVSDLKTFAYRSPEKGEADSPFLAEKAIDSAIRLTSHELRGVAVERRLPPDTLVRGDEAAIIGVLINLLSNAALAMHKVQRENPRIEIAAEWINDRLHVVVTDNGPGISEKNLSRVFEPFFTTREVGKGLGLGLSISYSVIQRHGGTLAVTSQEGEWARFTFDLPRSE
ncbi:GHKL domain-containing protein [Ralstonia insidiosa]|uniref:histidine kinase n=1 Tax=Ralstonia insidiosa TaxID=190721 RepID=A0A191ZZT5_9RALS|nr:two-component system sensor histidine kinase PhcS [Ralstonia insidiosa]ANJ73598.1 two-component sensor histidine kinase [Ralstonia insidiosa]KAB0473973.1 GHKL domain-containing protein [Ralstonia insidiosa]MBY4912072.1 GHKL domain-containing protein [Ralstonia insidiosa]